MATPAPGKVVEDVDDAPSPAVQDHQDLEKEDTVEFVDPLPKDYECPLCLQVSYVTGVSHFVPCLTVPSPPCMWPSIKASFAFEGFIRIASHFPELRLGLKL